MTSIAILEAVNTSYVPFNGQQVLTAMAAGVAYVAMRPIVENLGMSWSTQVRKLTAAAEKFNCVHMNMVGNAGGVHMNTPLKGGLQKMLCIPLKKLNGWLFSINPEKVRADIRDKLIQYQEECFTVLHDYWSKGKAENPRKTQQSTAKQLTPLRQTAERLIATGMGRLYPDIWKFVHQHFEIEHINQLKPSQISEAVTYLDALEGEFLGKQDAIQTPTDKQFTDSELYELVCLWSTSLILREEFDKVLPAMKLLGSSWGGNVSGYVHMLSGFINGAGVLLQRESSHISAMDNPPGNWVLELARMKKALG